MKLSDIEKEKVRFHLGYVEGGPSSSRTVLEYRLNNLRSPIHQQLVQQDIKRCDYALEKLGLDDQNTAVSSSTITIGDLDRNTTVYTSEPLKKRQKAYQDACAMLAQHLGVELLLGGEYQWQYTLEEVKLPAYDGESDSLTSSIGGRTALSRRYL